MRQRVGRIPTKFLDKKGTCTQQKSPLKWLYYGKSWLIRESLAPYGLNKLGIS